MLQKITTVIYVVIQLLFFAAGLTVLKYQTDLQASFTPWVFPRVEFSTR